MKYKLMHTPRSFDTHSQLSIAGFTRVYFESRLKLPDNAWH